MSGATRERGEVINRSRVRDTAQEEIFQEILRGESGERSCYKDMVSPLTAPPLTVFIGEKDKRVKLKAKELFSYKDIREENPERTCMKRS